MLKFVNGEQVNGFLCTFVKPKQNNMKTISKVPTRTEVENLQVGDLVMNCFGQFKEVTSIVSGGDDVNGKAYKVFYQQFGSSETTRMSHSIKEGEKILTVNGE